MSYKRVTTFTLKCPVCGRKYDKPASECVSTGEGDTMHAFCQSCYGIPMMLDKVTIKRIRA